MEAWQSHPYRMQDDTKWIHAAALLSSVGDLEKSLSSVHPTALERDVNSSFHILLKYNCQP